MMCKPGNQTISRACWEAIVAKLNRYPISNREARELLVKNDGCMQLDKKKVLVLN